MRSSFLDLLQQIASGIQIFEPFHRTARNLQEFQCTVERLLKMERLALIKNDCRCQVLRSSRIIFSRDFYRHESALSLFDFL
jgi:hypothetical protein